MTHTEVTDSVLPSNLSVDERILALEAVFSPSIPGTQIVRVCRKDQLGFEWSLGIGRMGCPKRFFTADTIAGCLDQTEVAIQEAKREEAQSAVNLARRRARKK